MTKSTFLKVLFILSFLPFVADCQPFTFDSASAFGGKTSSGGNSKMTTDNLGNIYVIGEYQGTRSFGSFQLTATGTTDIYVAKFDATGTCIWAVSGGGTASSAVTGGILFNMGSVYITGSFSGQYSMSFNSVTSVGQNDIFIAQLDPFSGYANWVYKAGGGQDDNSFGICAESGGGFYITGNITNSATFGTNNVVSNTGGFTNINMFLAKYTATGSCLWVQNAGSSSAPDGGYAVATLPNGNVVTTGYYEGPAFFGSITLIPSSGRDIFIASYSPTGTVNWAKRAAGLGTDNSNAITFDVNNNIYISGSVGDTAYFDSFQVPGNGYGTFFIAKYNSSGVAQWVKRAASGTASSGNSIVTDASGSSYVIGFCGTANFSGSVIVGSPGFVAKYNTSGGLTWITKLPAPNSNTFTSIAISPFGGGVCYLVGDFATTLVIGSTTLNPSTPNQPESFITRLSSGTVGFLEPWATAYLAVYPNPSTEKLNVMASNLNDMVVSVDIMSIEGQLISSTPVTVVNGAINFEMDIKDIPSGNYMMIINTSDKVHSSRFVKI